MSPIAELTSVPKSKNAEGVRDASVVIVSYNTKAMLRRCLESLHHGADGLDLEVIVVDNASRDGSGAMVAEEFPNVRLIESAVNLGFAAANNLAFAAAGCPYLVLLNSDAFLAPGALRRAIEHMEQEPSTGLGGGRLTGVNGERQPSARLFPSALNDFLTLSGLAHRLAGSRFFGRGDRTWADPFQPADVDWVPGAFSIVRADALHAVGGFDEAFFLYYEEVDLCRRLKIAGNKVRYWPDVVAVHVGGESSKSMTDAVRSRSGSQLTSWRIRSGLLYYRKHHSRSTWLPFAVEWGWHWMRALRNIFSRDAARREKAGESRAVMALLEQAWRETDGGRVSPPRPW